VFLKKSPAQDIDPSKLNIGSKINILSRQLVIAQYLDEATSIYVERNLVSSSLAIIKPDGYRKAGVILGQMQEHGFSLKRLRMLKLDVESAKSFYKEQEMKPFFPKLIEHMTSDVIVVIELESIDCVNKLRNLVEQQTNPLSNRAMFGSDGNMIAVHGSDSPQGASREIDFFFSKNWPTTALMDHCAIVIIKHDALQLHAGQIVTNLLEADLELSAMEIINVDLTRANEFLEVYKGVLPEYHDMSRELSKGPVLVIQVRQENVVARLRDLCGPMDPEMAREVAPHSLRARFGIDKIRNAVHCTDLIEDGPSESEYFFGN
jgi:nucleoside-diphosphate kinase